MKQKFIPQIRSRHGSHGAIRGKLPSAEAPVIVRLGSKTSTDKIYPELIKQVIEINTVKAVETSANKMLMKQKFTEAGVKTAEWMPAKAMSGDGKDGHEWSLTGSREYKGFNFPIVAKHHFGSRGTGNYLLKSPDDLHHWISGKDLSNYIFEKYYPFNREYRLHCTRDGCFYTCRKMLKNDTPPSERWYRNDSNCSWIMEDNPAFNKPSNWNVIVGECIKALVAIGLDVAAFDVKAQSSKDKDGNLINTPDFIVIESNSAPSFGEVTAEKYKTQLPIIIKQKMNEK